MHQLIAVRLSVSVLWCLGLPDCALLSVAVVHSCSVKARAHKGPVKVVYLLGADDYNEADVPADAFVIYQVRLVTLVEEVCGFKPHAFFGPGVGHLLI